MYVSVTDIKFPLRTQTVDQTPLVGPTATDVITTGTCGHLREGVITIILVVDHRNTFFIIWKIEQQANRHFKTKE